MATYQELKDLKDNVDLLDAVEVACWVSAEAIRTEAGATPNHANRLLWAKAVFEDPRAEAYRMLPALLAQNKDATVAQITGATDTAIQNNVDAAVDLFATG